MLSGQPSLLPANHAMWENSQYLALPRALHAQQVFSRRRILQRARPVQLGHTLQSTSELVANVEPVPSVRRVASPVQTVQQDLTHFLLLPSALYALQAPIPPTVEQAHALLVRRTRTATAVPLHVKHVIQVISQVAEQAHAMHAPEHSAMQSD